MQCLVITGASSGIGYATAETFRGDGYRVINLSRSVCDIDGALNLSGDLSDPSFLPLTSESLAAAVADADSLCLVHNAARLGHDTIQNIETDALRQIYEINLVAPTILNRMIRPHMNAGYSILNVGSTLGDKEVPSKISYVVYRQASIGVMRESCEDLAGTGITTACLHTEFNETEMLRDHIPDDVMPDIAQMSTFGRLIEPAEIGKTLLFAAQNPVINGSVINANLGQIER